MNNEVINWLLENDNPAVRYRTLTELLNQPADISDSKEWITNKIPENSIVLFVKDPSHHIDMIQC